MQKYKSERTTNLTVAKEDLVVGKTALILRLDPEGLVAIYQAMVGLICFCITYLFITKKGE